MKKLKTFQQDVQASIWFLEESELYATVKPYALAFTPQVPIPRENILRKEVSVLISDLRNVEQPFSLDRNGFTVLEFQEKHEDIDWNDETKVKEVHYPKIALQIELALHEARCIPLFHQVRKRHPAFPYSTGTDYTFGQPLRGAHVDIVHSSAEQLVREKLGHRAISALEGRYMVANVWHPLKGPNQDWPLALCDAATVDSEKDLEVADYVTAATNREHCLLYARDIHKWWYLSSQKTTEAFLFRQYDSEKGAKSGVPHASFLNPFSPDDETRESIEVIVLIYWP